MKKKKLTNASRIIDIDRLTKVDSNALKGGRRADQDTILVPKIEIPKIIIRA